MASQPKKPAQTKKASTSGGPQPLPPIAKGFLLPFYYSSLTNVDIMYLVDKKRVTPYLAGTGLAAADFSGQACVSYNFQSYTGQFPWGSSFVQEIELNIVAYPEALLDNTAQMTFEEFALGNDQTKLFGNHRVHVPCDNDQAIQAGVELFGEPKFKTTFTTDLPSLNAGGGDKWTFTCNDPTDAKKTIFTVTADVGGLTAQAADISPQTEYGQNSGRLIGCRWNILQPFDGYLLAKSDSKRVQMKLGNSTHKMRADLAALIGDAPARAVRTFQSRPAATQARAYFV